MIFALWAIREACGAIFALFFAFDTVFSLQKQFLPCFLHAGLFFCPKSNFRPDFCTLELSERAGRQLPSENLCHPRHFWQRL
ncbi:MAG: hypothetical protein ACI3ZI_02880, partial [Candidatus Cryptobacteroides sp.]